MGYAPPSDIDPAARALIRHKARTYGFLAGDPDDLEQELALTAHVARAKYDPSRGSLATFYDRVLTNKVRSLAVAARRLKRDGGRITPLDAAPPPVEEGADLDLHLDVAEALASLAPGDRTVADLLVDDTAVGVARTTGTTRGHVRSARARIARRLTAAGVGRDFLAAGQPIRG